VVVLLLYKKELLTNKNDFIMEQMFCFQCQETAFNHGCTFKGVCGKDAQIATLMDTLLYGVKGLASVNKFLREKSLNDIQTSRFELDCLFCTITNANFDYKAIEQKTTQLFALKDSLITLARNNNIDLPQEFKSIFYYPTPEQYTQGRELTAIDSPARANEDIRSLQEMIMYGVKGLSAYMRHALRLGYEDVELYKSIDDALYAIARQDLGAQELTAQVFALGSAGVRGMALLDKANTETYGSPEITTVNIGIRNNPAILVSGHDLKDLEELLIQTQGTGVDVYTHSEMLPAHAYPKFKKYTNFVGNYGNAWHRQREEFSSFNGPILFTTNCIVPPAKDSNYAQRIFTTGSAGLAGATHIPEIEGKAKDFSQIIALAKQCQPPKAIEQGQITTGFAHAQVLTLAGKVIEAVKSGDIKHFVVMAGCDGRAKQRDYYTEFAKALPQDTVILTAGCAKYRFNKLNLGSIGGIPRVLDAGQCNDSYSLVVIALALKEAFGLKDINDLPIVYNISWYEQKAVIVLLALLSLGVKNIHLGPTLPAFVSENVLKLLIEQFNIGTISTVENDIASWLK